MIQAWYEVWVDESTTIPYVLFLCPDPSHLGGMLIIDPKKENKVIQRLSDYNTAVFWLAEDEYMNQLWDSNPVHDDRDIISLSHARLAFAGRSSSRWF